MTSRVAVIARRVSEARAANWKRQLGTSPADRKTYLNARDSQIRGTRGLATQQSSSGTVVESRSTASGPKPEAFVTCGTVHSVTILVAARSRVLNDRVGLDAFDQNASHMLSSDDVEVRACHIRIVIGTSCVGACLVDGVQITGHKRSTCRASIVWIELRRYSKVVQSGKEIG